MFKRGTEAVARALLDTVVAKTGGCVLTNTPRFKVKLSDVAGQRRVKGKREGVDMGVTAISTKCISNQLFACYPFISRSRYICPPVFPRSAVL